MASIRRTRSRYEIRECRGTPAGPRQAILASFKRALTPEVLDEAQASARLPFDRDAVARRARAMGVPVTRRRSHPEARRLLGVLQRGGVPTPALVARLRALLDPLPSEPVPEHLLDAQDWVGQPQAEHGRALRGLVRTADRIVQSRGALRSRPRRVFPRFSSRPVESDE
ncbi:MAG: hypothetical protein JRG76_18610 [Deltaproteobacteria bacterium]|nr:hypothetical protein [Deltaproteobacteria bacterium]MBW2416513.1 hypothetical protein [Deltaproteobacteria bacterium]